VVDEMSDACLPRTRSQFIRGYQPRDRRIDKSDFRLHQEAERVGWRRRRGAGRGRIVIGRFVHFWSSTILRAAFAKDEG
jgi:hypothetical protein